MPDGARRPVAVSGTSLFFGFRSRRPVLVLQADDAVEEGGARRRVRLVGDEVSVADELETAPGAAAARVGSTRHPRSNSNEAGSRNSLNVFLSSMSSGSYEQRSPVTSPLPGRRLLRRDREGRDRGRQCNRRHYRENLLHLDVKTFSFLLQKPLDNKGKIIAGFRAHPSP